MSNPIPAPTESQPERLYKFLNADQTGRHSRKRLPTGEWIVIDGPLAMCRNGIHVTTIANATKWLDERAHLVEIRGERIVGDDKLCCREVYIHPALPGWDRAALVGFAADCAEHVLHLFEAKYPNDDRPRKAIKAARSGDAQRARTYAAAAADAAYTAAAADAAYTAAYAAAAAAADAAYTAAYAADAAYTAAYAAVGGVGEREWQSERLAALLHGGAE